MRFSYQSHGQSLNVHRRSLLSNYVLNPFWTWFVTLWPEWVAPNMVRDRRFSRCASTLCVACSYVALQITLSGLSIILLNFATLIYYDPTYLAEKGGATGPPNWIYFTCVCFSASQLFVILVAAVQPKCGLTQLEYRWAIGLFLYQTFDAIDGCVPSIQIVME